MTHRNLEEALHSVGNAVEILRNSQIGPYAFPVVKHEFTNWRDEQRSWRETCALFDQSHHMTDLYVEGPDALKVFSDLAVNSFKNFKVDTAKQFVATSHNGYVIGDAILFYLSENKFNLVGRPPAANWVEYNVSTRKYNAKTERDERSAQNNGRRKTFRFQLQGPHALKTMQKILGKTPPDVRFFAMDRFTIGGRDVRALRHGMVGQPGLGALRTVEDGDKRVATRSSRRPGVRHPPGRRENVSDEPVPSLAGSSPCPAIYTGDEMKAYRQWLSGTSYAMAVGGSFVSRSIEDYYLTP
jgi:glycine cleavage system aminomethyltransferase T